MPELLIADEPVRAERDSWMYDNRRGLSLAALAEWDEAAEAFAAAADVLSRRTSDERAHDALALILGNLAQACFRAGREHDALQHAQRACAIRVALAGEDAIPVARSRMDLAVMLGSVGRLDEAQLLMQRAISAMEAHVGEEDARLAIMLENAARLALAAGIPANAEPLLLRLHALLDLHGLSTDRAEQLLAMVAAVRTGTRTVVPAMTHSTISVAAPAGVVSATVTYDEPVEEQVSEWEDQPLRDAVALTDVLLRTTPSGVRAIPAPGPYDAEILAAFETVIDTPTEPICEVEELPDVAEDDFMLDLADDFDAPVVSSGSMVLGFTVEHGFSGAELDPPVTLSSTNVLGTELDDTLVELVVPSAEATTPSEDALVSVAAEPVQALVTVSAADAGAARIDTFQREAPASSPPLQGAHENDDHRPRAKRVPLSARNRDSAAAAASGSKGGVIAAGAAAVAAAGAAAWYFLLR